MAVRAFPALVRVDDHAYLPAPDGLIPLTCNGIRRLFTTLAVQPVRGTAHRPARSA